MNCEKLSVRTNKFFPSYTILKAVFAKIAAFQTRIETHNDEGFGAFFIKAMDVLLILNYLSYLTKNNKVYEKSLT